MFAPSGSATVDALGLAASEVLNPMIEGPPEDAGLLEHTSYFLNAALGSVGFVLSTAPDYMFAALTSDIAAAYPKLPAAVLGDMQIGLLHIHTHPPSFIAPAAPIPLPSIGMVMLAGSASVLLGGVPAARAGDVGFAIACGSLMPAFEIMTGSSNVFIGGGRAARSGDLTRHCNPIGMVGAVMGALGVVAGAVGAAVAATDEEANPAAAAVAAAQVAADAGALAIQATIGKDAGMPFAIGGLIGSSPNVVIGGFPMPSLLEALTGLLKLVKKIRRVRARSLDGESVSRPR